MEQFVWETAEELDQKLAQQVLGKVKESVDESNTVMGEFMCQGMCWKINEGESIFSPARAV